MRDVERGRQEPVRYIDRTREQYRALGYDSYEWADNQEPPPWVDVTKPLAESRLGQLEIPRRAKAQAVKESFGHRDHDSLSEPVSHFVSCVMP